ncbi:MAG: RNA polymerase sigma factor [Oscillospiraceae bacterium]|nr:RNA polymerase sigma factor [Oscillospiraceae bacterium]
MKAKRKDGVILTDCNRTALEKDIEAYSDTILRIAVQNTKNYHDAEDVVQEVFIRLMNNYDGFESGEHKKAWLIRVTINLCRDINRSRRFKGLEPLEDYPCFYGDELKNCEIIEMIRNLPENRRNAVYLFYFEGYSINEIAEITGRNAKSVGSDLHRARKQLKLEMED